MLIDTHCHLDKLDLSPYAGDLGAAIAAADHAGVRQILAISVDLENSEKVLSYTQYDGVFATVGVHPLHTEGLLHTSDPLRQLAEHERVIALGETGLDFFYENDESIRQLQQQSFAIHLELAASLSLPVIVHTRHARQQTLALIKHHGNRESGGVLHCFTEDYAMAKAAMDENYLISISGIVTFRNADELRDVVRKLPLERLLIETDAPYLAPVPYRGQQNEPKYVAAVAQYVADLKGIHYDALLEQTAANFHRHFSRASMENQLSLAKKIEISSDIL